MGKIFYVWEGYGELDCYDYKDSQQEIRFQGSEQACREYVEYFNHVIFTDPKGRHLAMSRESWKEHSAKAVFYEKFIGTPNAAIDRCIELDKQFPPTREWHEETDFEAAFKKWVEEQVLSTDKEGVDLMISSCRKVAQDWTGWQKSLDEKFINVTPNESVRAMKSAFKHHMEEVLSDLKGLMDDYATQFIQDKINKWIKEN